MATKILVVDDEPSNVFFLSECLSAAGFEVLEAADGIAALALLHEHPDVEAVLLDRMMPRMDGMEVLRRMKEDSRFRDLPVIMQTAVASTNAIMEGIQAGVYYYLTKPYAHTMLLSIMRAALEDARSKKAMRDEVRKHKHALGLMQQGQFRFRTLDETSNLASFIASCFPNPETAVTGLSELMINAVEHGNLGISYAEKTQLMLAGAWREEVERRLLLSENREKYAHLAFDADAAQVRVQIRDQGSGFDWRGYLEISPERATAPHGRGIAIARISSFSSIQYLGCGNEVVCAQEVPAH